MEKTLFLVNLVANFLLFYNLLNRPFNIVFNGGVFSQILWLMIMLFLTFGTSFYTFNYLKKKYSGS